MYPGTVSPHRGTLIVSVNGFDVGSKGRKDWILKGQGYQACV